MPRLTFGVLATLVAFNGVAQPAVAPVEESRVAKARLLYACFTFSKEGARGAASPQKEKLERIARNFLTLATVEIVAADPDKDPLHTELAQRTGKQGQSDFYAMMEEVEKLPTVEQRNQRIGEFAASCSAAAGVKP